MLTGDGYCIPAGVSYCGAGRYCTSGNVCMSDGRCVPRGVTYCGGGRYCQPGNICTSSGCLPASSERVCSNGAYCQQGYMCMNDGRCLATSSERYCGGRRYCDPGYVCAAGGGCRLAAAPTPPPPEGKPPAEKPKPEPQPETAPAPSPPTLPPGPIGQQPAPRPDPAPPPAPKQEAPAPPPPPAPVVTQPPPPPAPPRPAPLAVPGAPGGDGRVNGSCEAYYASMLEMFRTNARQCGISSSKLATLTSQVLGPNIEPGFRGILKLSDHPDIFGADGSAAGERWAVSGSFARPKCELPLGEGYSECARTYVCAMIAAGCGRDLARDSTFLTCPAASQQCLAKNPVPQ